MVVPTYTGGPRKLFHHAESHRRLEAAVAMIPVAPGIVQAGSRPFHHSRGAGSAGSTGC